MLAKEMKVSLKKMWRGSSDFERACKLFFAKTREAFAMHNSDSKFTNLNFRPLN
jgi:hypothetical protein